MCRINQQCNHGMICLFGKCVKPVEHGQVGAQCSSDEDCAKDHCCAKTLGFKICKRKLRLNEKCYVPHGGLDYSLNEQCPCSDGLVCEAIESYPGGLRTIMPKNPRVEHLRCSLGQKQGKLLRHPVNSLQIIECRQPNLYRIFIYHVTALSSNVNTHHQ